MPEDLLSAEELMLPVRRKARRRRALAARQKRQTSEAAQPTSAGPLGIHPGWLAAARRPAPAALAQPAVAASTQQIPATVGGWVDVADIPEFAQGIRQPTGRARGAVSPVLSPAAPASQFTEAIAGVPQRYAAPFADRYEAMVQQSRNKAFERRERADQQRELARRMQEAAPTGNLLEPYYSTTEPLSLDKRQQYLGRFARPFSGDLGEYTEFMGQRREQMEEGETPEALRAYRHEWSEGEKPAVAAMEETIRQRRKKRRAGRVPEEIRRRIRIAAGQGRRITPGQANLEKTIEKKREAGEKLTIDEMMASGLSEKQIATIMQGRQMDILERQASPEAQEIAHRRELEKLKLAALSKAIEGGGGEGGGAASRIQRDIMKRLDAIGQTPAPGGMPGVEVPQPTTAAKDRSLTERLTQQAEQDLAQKDAAYDQIAPLIESGLSPEELTKFQEDWQAGNTAELREALTKARVPRQVQDEILGALPSRPPPPPSWLSKRHSPGEVWDWLQQPRSPREIWDWLGSPVP